MPIYLGGLVWIILACFLKMTQLSDYLICIAAALLTYVISEKVKFKPEVITETTMVPESEQEARCV